MICVVYNLKELRFRRPGCTHCGHLMLRLRQPSSFCREPPSSPLCLTTTTAPSRLDQMSPLRMSLKFVSASFCSHRTFCNPLLEYLSLFVGEFHCRHLLDASSHGEAWLQDWSFGSHSWHYMVETYGADLMQIALQRDLPPIFLLSFSPLLIGRRVYTHCLQFCSHHSLLNSPQPTACLHCFSSRAPVSPCR